MLQHIRKLGTIKDLIMIRLLENVIMTDQIFMTKMSM